MILNVAKRAVPFLWDQYARDRARVVEQPAYSPHPHLWPDTGLHTAWLGHSTVLLKIDGIVILTDPVLSNRIGLSVGPMTVGMKRLVAPALLLPEIPAPDILLLSHAHMDHFDIPTLRSLESAQTQVVTASKTSDLLRTSRYEKVTELAWGEAITARGVTVRAFEVKHWGARMRNDTFRGYNGYVLETGRYRVIFGGDTADTDSFRTLRSSRRFDLAIMPIGAYNPWLRAHCTPEQAVRMANDAGAEVILPVHHQTFELGREPRREPVERLAQALLRTPERLALRDIGQEFHL